MKPNVLNELYALCPLLEGSSIRVYALCTVLETMGIICILKPRKSRFEISDFWYRMNFPIPTLQQKCDDEVEDAELNQDDHQSTAQAIVLV